MALKGVIRLGDPTSGGGKVISASGFMVDGKPVALIGDTCTCPCRGHGSSRIVEGSTSDIFNGKEIA